METQSKIGWRPYVNPSITASSLWNSIYSVYNADAVGSSSLKTSLYAAYNGESNANDSFGSNNGTAVGGLTYGTGKIGNAFTFNGSNSYVSLPNNSLNLTGDFSVSAWVKYTVGSGIKTILSNNTLLTSPTRQYGWGVYLNSNSILFQTYDGTSTVGSLSYAATLTSGTWYHITITKSGTTKRIYLNGAEVANASVNNITYTATHRPTIGGQRYDATGMEYFSVSPIDAVSVWNKELTASEITELYNSGNGAQYITDSFYKPTTNDALNTNNGTAQGGLTYGLGKVGTAFVGNGTNGYVSLPNTSGQFNFAGDFSVSMWFRSSNLSTSRYAVGNYKAVGSYGYGWILYYTYSGGGFAFDVRNNNNINQVAKILSLATNTWYHVVAVRKVGQIHKLYVNGVDQLAPQTDGNVNNIAAYTANQPMNICGLSDINLPTLCDLDGVNMWNRTLTQADVTELYNSGNGKQYPN